METKQVSEKYSVSETTAKVIDTYRHLDDLYSEILEVVEEIAGKGSTDDFMKNSQIEEHICGLSEAIRAKLFTLSVFENLSYLDNVSGKNGSVFI